MAIDPTTLLFFDAACLIAAAGSPSGGSSFLLTLVQRALLAGAASHPVLLEAERNIRAKLPTQARDRFEDLLRQTSLTIASLPPPSVVARFVDVVGPKDAHVLAAALAVQAPFLLTLDRPLAQRVNASGLPLRALTPGEFITTELPSHPDYGRVREP